MPLQTVTGLEGHGTQINRRAMAGLWWSPQPDTWITALEWLLWSWSGLLKHTFFCRLIFAPRKGASEIHRSQDQSTAHVHADHPQIDDSILGGVRWWERILLVIPAIFRLQAHRRLVLDSGHASCHAGGRPRVQGHGPLHSSLSVPHRRCRMSSRCLASRLHGRGFHCRQQQRLLPA